ncbi:MAG: DNA polymerase III subunit delta' [Deltaproteobacteria bacterium]|nr:DNA polymerase III subunit delta' [Deltaproteobacteria bacterium]
MGFAEIRDQDRAVGTLRRALAASKVPHAYLFEGPAGVGKSLAATALSMALNCEREGSDACGECGSCRKILEDVHPDVIRIGLPEGKKLIPIDAVRDLEKRLYFRPHEGRAKVAVIDPADGLTEPAANALLKTLEEPRADAFLVLVTSRASALLATVRSRCQRVRFRALGQDTVREILEAEGVSPAEASVVAMLAEGGMDRAARYLGEDLEARIEAAFDLFAGATEETPMKGLAAAAALKGDRDEVVAVLDLMLVILGEVAFLRSADAWDRQALGALGERLGPRLEELARRGDVIEAAKHVALVHRAKEGIERNNQNAQLALEGMLVAMRGNFDPGPIRVGMGAR